MSAVYQLFARDDTLTHVGEADDFASLDITLLFNGVSRWALYLPFAAKIVGELFDGVHRGLDIHRNGATLLSGPITKLERRFSNTTDQLVVYGVDDTVWLDRRYVLPYTLAAGWTDYDTRSGVAETVIKGYVRDNATAAGYFAAYAVPDLIIAPDDLRGSTVSGSGRLDSLLGFIAGLALAGGDLGFRVVQAGADISFDVYTPADRSAEVTFSVDFGNVDEFNYSRDVPSANHIRAGGSGQGAARTYAVAEDSASITRNGLIAKFIDERNTADSTQLAQQAAAELLRSQGRADYALTSTLSTLEYGADYSLGDKVRVVVDGASIVQPIRQVHITYNAQSGGEKLTPLIAPPNPGTGPLEIYDEVRRLRARVAALEGRY